MSEGNNNTNPDFTTENAIRLTAARNAEGAVVPDKNGNQRTKEFPIFSESAYRDLDVYKIDINLVYFNFENLRIGKYKKNKMKKENIDELDPTNADHQEFVAQILRNAKDYGQKKVADLEKWLLTAGQLEPALITENGTLWNGNRRCALMRKLFNNPPATGLGNLENGFIKVCFLPEGMTPEQLRSLEKRLQQEPDSKAEYGITNEMIHVQDTLNEFEGDIENVTDTQRNELMADCSSSNFETWDSCLKAKMTVDLMDQYLESRNQHDQRELSGFYQMFEEAKGGVVTWFQDVQKLLYTHVEPFFTDHPQIGGIDYDADEMFEAWKQNCFLSLDQSLEKDETEVYGPIRALWKVFENASGDISSTEAGDTTAYLVSLLENSDIIKNWDELSSKEPEEFVTFGTETVDVGGIQTPIKQKVNEEIHDSRTFVAKLGKSPAVRLERVRKDLNEITDNLDSVGPNDTQITTYIDDCRQSLTEIEDQNSREVDPEDDSNSN